MAALLIAPLAGPPAAACGPETLEDAVLARVENGEALLADGRRVRLAGVAFPDAARREAAAWPAPGARLALAALGEGDRWGRVPALVFAHEGGGGAPVFLQGMLLAAGAARAWPDAALPGADWAGCRAPLLAAEARARGGAGGAPAPGAPAPGALGLWADPVYAAAPAATLRAPGERAGRGVVIEGRVRRVGEGRARLFIDFAGAPREGFTASVPRRRLRAFAAAGLDPKGLDGRTLRLRGLLEASPDGARPRMTLDRPAQVEVLLEAPARGASARGAPVKELPVERAP